MKIEDVYNRHKEIANKAFAKMIDHVISNADNVEDAQRIVGAMILPSLISYCIEEMEPCPAKTKYAAMLKGSIDRAIGSDKEIPSMRDFKKEELDAIFKMEASALQAIKNYWEMHPKILQDGSMLVLIPEVLEIIKQFSCPEKIKKEMQDRIDKKLIKWAQK